MRFGERCCCWGSWRADDSGKGDGCYAGGARHAGDAGVLSRAWVSEARNSSDAFASFLTSGAILALFPFAHLAHDARVEPSDIGERFRGVTIAINVETRDLVDGTIDELRAAGARVTKEPEDAVWGGRSAYFADPEGNAWEVVWAPGTSFDADGKFVWG